MSETFGEAGVTVGAAAVMTRTSGSAELESERAIASR